MTHTLPELVEVRVLSYREQLNKVSGDLFTQVHRMSLLEPQKRAPVSDWLLWHDRLADLYDRIAADGGAWAGNAGWAADSHRCAAKQLREQPMQRGRTGRR